ncbi:hypothetical protein HYPSUDRAFT_203970 [Hypholoma sublateritium FD-334 SS-4]|uniref:Uncharacterized protein n=1 Tax=Hypholoma sublateritium (strain FD-334 SS-4) TaxID=945553 RepID=A0A0D2MAA2_HYPSF|nr:hypothetical protein HYPSUDRAFT_203970 [Hypholoma sublateritium FD-334 SS-4]
MSSRIFDALRKSDDGALIELVKEAPTWETVNNIIAAYPAVARVYPKMTLKIAETLCEAKKLAEDLSGDLIALSDPDYPSDRLDLEYELQICVYDMLMNVLRVPTDNAPLEYTDITPKNDFIIAGMISGACHRIALCKSPEQRRPICEGFQFPGYIVDRNEQWSELYAIHACMALLVGGHRLYSTITYFEPGKLALGLKRLVEKDVIKDSNGNKLLQLIIKQVEEQFETEIEVEEIWKTLFPPPV